jgi:hypothetical protein
MKPKPTDEDVVFEEPTVPLVAAATAVDAAVTACR